MTFALEKLIGPMDGDEFNQMMYEHGVSVCHDIIVTYSDAERWVVLCVDSVGKCAACVDLLTGSLKLVWK